MWTAQPYSSTQISYSCSETDLSMQGNWLLNAKLVNGSLQWFGDTVKMPVYPLGQ